MYLALAGMALTLLPTGAFAQAVNIVKVEEDWELVVDQPDSDTTAPQVTCMISPTGDEDGLHMTFELNHKSGAQFVPGGLTAQVWEGESWVSTNRGNSSAAMTTAVIGAHVSGAMRGEIFFGSGIPVACSRLAGGRPWIRQW